MVQVLIPSQLQSYTGGASRAAARGGTVDAVLTDIDGQYLGIRFRVIDEQGRIRRHMRLYVGQEWTLDIARSLDETDEVLIFGALGGG